MKGEVVYNFIYDLGAEVDLQRVGEILDERPHPEQLEIRKTAPKYVDLPRPLTLRLRPVTRATTLGPRTFDVQVRVFGIGAVSVTLKLAFDVPDLAALIPFGPLRLVDAEAREQPLETTTREIVEKIRHDLDPALVEHYPGTTEPETYVVFAVQDASPYDPSSLLAKERQALAGLLGGEPDWKRLSREEVEDNLRYWYRYYEDDLVVVDWDYALVVEPSGKWNDVLYVCELANLQLLELRAYDRYLDEVLDKAYADLDRFFGRKGLFASAREIQMALSEARIDLTRVTDEINNIGKIFGDWFLAKLHVGLTSRFHLPEWESIVREKMEALDGLYGLATHEVEHRRSMFLEVLIVLLFVIDLVLIYLVSA